MITVINIFFHIVQDMVKTVEQLGKEFNWEGAVKHSKVLELIEGKTGLSDDEIYNIIKSTVLEVNQYVNKNDTKDIADVAVQK
ncbi:hypothetical protein [Clostridium sp.]|jgi:hypothetical protein|uniref:hypothetical protein n=1 Tax=Clostridium sp. TaxID=1506 RepID=UPI003A2346AD